MPNSKENQFWLVEDKNDFKTLKDEVVCIEQNYLLDIDNSIKSKFNNSYGVNDKHIEFTSVFEIINNIKLRLNLLRTNLEPLKKRIIKNLENKKINSFKNFVIKIFTCGKINRNRDFENEISRFNFGCQYIKNKCENIVEKLNTKTNELLCEIEKRHYDIKIERDKLKQSNYKLETIIRDNKEKIKQLESNIKENENKINTLEQENQKHINFIDSKNVKFDSQCVTLENIINENQKEKIKFHMKQNQELKQEIKLRDSGIESASEVFDSDIDSFNQEKINAEQNKHMTKSRIKPRIVQIN